VRGIDWRGLAVTVLVVAAVWLLGSAGCLGRGPHPNPWYGPDD
jgi:hypothetical protein